MASGGGLPPRGHPREVASVEHDLEAVRVLYITALLQRVQGSRGVRRGVGHKPRLPTSESETQPARHSMRHEHQTVQYQHVLRSALADAR